MIRVGFRVPGCRPTRRAGQCCFYVVIFADFNCAQISWRSPKNQKSQWSYADIPGFSVIFLNTQLASAQV